MTKNTKTKSTSPTTVAELTSQLKWRLQKAPTIDDVALMVRESIISKEEAKQILFSEEVKDESSEKIAALKEQIEFLEKVVDKLANRTINNTYGGWPVITYVPTQPLKHWTIGSGVGIANSGGIYAVNTASNTVSLSSNITTKSS